MDTNTSLSQSAAHLKKVIPMMSSYKVPYTPINYAIWYCYALGQNLKLNLRLDSILEQHQTCPPAEAKVLFDEFLTEKDLSVFYEISSDFQDSISQVKGDIDNTLASSQEFTAFLNSCNAGLHDIQHNSLASYDEVLSIVSRLSEESASMQHKAHTFQRRLEVAYKEISTLKQTLMSAQEVANLDSLTELSNRTRFNFDIKRLLTEHVSKQGLLSLVFIDIDYFKKFNADFGHQKADDVLKVVANKLKSVCNHSINAYRYDGKLFCILGVFKDVPQVLSFTENLRQSIGELSVKGKKTGTAVRYISVSCGVALFDEDQLPQGLIERANRALYMAKSHGKNRVEIA
ncbi:GGDEF domain-containing protein [Pseudoalteromonas shioyasakiensis]|uniref:GGDEF domain-containing protein n=1 Tax=Pseudoalteromonas shioyasakiensis TaxID=1190813 RepID=UPI002119A198|nr:GGDEF domain-containing protein [Pseudoalteromonas shioyasakiensis]MCQ8877165.1 GGDEF domain-containing protein [Pseudoalteromonas shioyasakiensis]